MKLEKIFILLQIFLIIYIEIIFGQYQKEFPDSSSRPISQDIQQLKFEIFLGLAQRKECLLLAPLYVPLMFRITPTCMSSISNQSVDNLLLSTVE